MALSKLQATQIYTKFFFLKTFYPMTISVLIIIDVNRFCEIHIIIRLLS